MIGVPIWALKTFAVSVLRLQSLGESRAIVVEGTVCIAHKRDLTRRQNCIFEFLFVDLSSICGTICHQMSSFCQFGMSAVQTKNIVLYYGRIWSPKAYKPVVFPL
jgi:hypothetical protein